MNHRLDNVKDVILLEEYDRSRRYRRALVVALRDALHSLDELLRPENQMLPEAIRFIEERVRDSYALLKRIQEDYSDV